MTQMTSKEAEETCSGYLRKAHNAPPVLYLLYPDGTKHGLCRVCATRWLLSDEEWPPENKQNEDKTSTLTTTENAPNSAF